MPLKPEGWITVLSLDLNVVVVENMDGAIAHIRERGTQHSDAILTCDMHNAARFVNEVDSLRFMSTPLPVLPTAGSLNWRRKLAVSTQGTCPRSMGLEALTTYKWIGFGDGTIRA